MIYWDLGAEVDMGDGKTVLYEGKDCLGQGATGAVFPCMLREVVDGGEERIKEVAVKYEVAKDEGMSQMYIQQQDIWKCIKPHQNVTKFYTGRRLKLSGGKFAVLSVTDLMQGDLKGFIHIDEQFKSTCTFGDIVEILKQICKGLKHTHDNEVIHYDLKPKNILYSRTDDGKLEVRLTDFGNSKIVKHKKSVTASFRGTEGYMAPELLGAISFCDTPCRLRKAIDIYSFGVLMWEILNNTEPSAELHCKHRVGKEISWQTAAKEYKIWCEAPMPLCELVQSCLSFDGFNLPSSSDHGRPKVTDLLLKLEGMKNEEWLGWRATAYLQAEETDFIDVRPGPLGVEPRQSAEEPLMQQVGTLQEQDTPSHNLWDLKDEIILEGKKTVIYAKGDYLYRGAFTVVFPCIMKDKGDNRGFHEVAVRCENSDDDDKVLKEQLKLWRRIPKHKNILELLAGSVLKPGMSKFRILQVTERMKLRLIDLIFHDECFKRTCTYYVIVDILEQICQGVAHLHEHGYIHHDLKPESVLVSMNGSGRMCAKLTNFNCSKTIAEGEDCIASRCLGTMDYMAPEVLSVYPVQDANVKFTRSIDIFSLGVLMWVLLNRKTQGDHDSCTRNIGRKITWSWVGGTRDVWCEAPEPLCKLVESCLCFKGLEDPSGSQGRPSIKAVLKELETIKKGNEMVYRVSAYL